MCPNSKDGGSGGSRSYWEGTDSQIMNRIGDNHARYYDGANGGWLNTAGSMVYKNLAPGDMKKLDVLVQICNLHLLTADL